MRLPITLRIFKRWMLCDQPIGRIAGSHLFCIEGIDFSHGENMVGVDRHEIHLVQQFSRVFTEHLGFGYGNELVTLIVQQIQKPGVGQREDRAFNSFAGSPDGGDDFYLFDHAFVRHAIFLQTGVFN